jgi:hypothetical protein
MRRAYLASVGLCSLALCGGSGAQEVPDPRPTVEGRLLRALGANLPQAIAAIAREVRELPVERRRAIPFRVRASEVSFEFRGIYPSMMGEAAQGMEYVLARAGTKDWETLLAVSVTEADRARALGSLLVARRKVSARPPRVELAWFDGTRVRVEDLRDVLRLETPDRRKTFLAGLTPYASGLGQSNVRTDPALLPTKSVSATVIVTVFREAQEEGD